MCVLFVPSVLVLVLPECVFVRPSVLVLVLPECVCVLFVCPFFPSVLVLVLPECVCVLFVCPFLPSVLVLVLPVSVRPGRRVRVLSVVGHSVTGGQLHSSTCGHVGSGAQVTSGESVTLVTLSVISSVVIFNDCAVAKQTE